MQGSIHEHSDHSVAVKERPQLIRVHGRESPDRVTDGIAGRKKRSASRLSEFKDRRIQACRLALASTVMVVSLGLIVGACSERRPQCEVRRTRSTVPTNL